MTNSTFINLLKWFLFLLATNGYSIFMLTLAQYLSAVFVFAKNTAHLEVFSNVKLHLIILASSFSLVAGSLINLFYDEEKDRINKPLFSRYNQKINKSFKLYLYIICNTISLGLAFWISMRAFFFFLIYQFFIWIYSHKISKLFIFNNLASTALILMPFFAIMIYYGNYANSILFLGVYLFGILLLYDILKDIATTLGDATFHYQTLPTILGVSKTIKCLQFASIFMSFTSLYLSFKLKFGAAQIYFVMSALMLLVMFFMLRRKQIYVIKNIAILIFLMKIILTCGVFSIIFIDADLISLEKLL